MYIRYRWNKDPLIKFTSQTEKSDIDCSDQDQQYINLYKINIFEYLKKDFKISTNNSSYMFNIEILKEISSVISQHIIDNQLDYHYHLNMDDDGNILGKFESILDGNPIILEEQEFSIFNQIINNLKIQGLIDLIEKQKEKHSITIKIEKSSLFYFLEQNSDTDFIISTNKKEYECKRIGALSSQIIKNFIEENPTADKYYYDFDDEFDEFKHICDLFNFQLVFLSNSNMQSLKKIAEELKIDAILDDINENIEENEKMIASINEQQELIDSIDELLNWLCNLNEENISSVKDSIVNSLWSQTEDNIKELAAYIIQASESNILKNQTIVDLLIQLDQESGQTNQLKKLLPFIIKKSLDLFGKTEQNCSFVYNLYKRKLISEATINHKLNNAFSEKPKKPTNNRWRMKVICPTINESQNIIDWFLPEIVQIEDLREKALKKHEEFLQIYWPDNIEDYKKMRDNGEPFDEITLSLRHDDVDKFQHIISMSNIDITKNVVPYNIFEDYVKNGKTSYLDYAAAYGSIRCFKYLLLNHAVMSQYTNGCAIHGGNNEIIQIVHQQNSPKPETKKNGFRSFSDVVNGSRSMINVIPSITKHENDIFDWIINQSNILYDLGSNSSNLALFSLENGNIHSFVEIIIHRHCSFKPQSILHWLLYAAKNGFYRLMLFIYNVFKQKIKDVKIEKKDDFYQPENLFPVISFGNLSIFTILYQFFDEDQYDLLLFYVMKYDYTKYNADFVSEMFTNHHFDSEKSVFFNYFTHFISTHGISEEALKLFDEYDSKHNENFYSTITESEQKHKYSTNKLEKLISISKFSWTNYYMYR